MGIESLELMSNATSFHIAPLHQQLDCWKNKMWKQLIMSRGRSFIFSTAMPLPMAAAAHGIFLSIVVLLVLYLRVPHGFSKCKPNNCKFWCSRTREFSERSPNNKVPPAIVKEMSHSASFERCRLEEIQRERVLKGMMLRGVHGSLKDLPPSKADNMC